MRLFNKKIKPVLVEMSIYSVPTSNIPEYQGYELPKELDSFLSAINTYSEQGFRIKLKKTSIEEIYINLMRK